MTRLARLRDWSWRGLWGVAILLIGFYFAVYLPMPVDGVTGDLDSFTPGGYLVRWVIEPRPSGLRAGDLILTIDGDHYADWLSGNRPIERWQTGDVLTYEVQRGDEILTLDIEMRPLQFWSLLNHWGIPLITMLGFVGISTLIMWHRSDDIAATWWVLFCMMNAVQMHGDMWNFQPALLVHPTLFRIHFIVEHLSYILIFTAVILEALTFPYPPKWITHRGDLIAAGVSAIGAAGIFIPFVVSADMWRLGLHASNSASVIMAGTYLTIGTGIFIWNYRHTSDQAVRAQMRWLIFTAVIVLVIAIPFHYLPIVVLGQSILPQTVSTPMLLFMLMAFVIAITQYNLYQIDLLINRTIVYITLAIILGLSFAIIVWGFSQGMMLITHQPVPSWLTAFLAGLLGMSFDPLRKRIQRYVDRRFYHIRIDYQSAAERVERFRESDVNMPVGTHFGPYSDVEYLTRGGSSQIYKATNQDGKPVAIKILPPLAGEDMMFRRRFKREADILSQLSHPGIVQLYDYGEAFGSSFIVLEYIEGMALSNFIDKYPSESRQQALDILQEVATALDYAHSQHLIHRDIKPSNILLEIDPDSSQLKRAVISDFGIAYLENDDTRMTLSGMVGTFEYISPEQIESAGEVDRRADIYSLGVVAYELLTGKLPFRSSSVSGLLIAHLMHPPPDPGIICPDMPENQQKALLKALAKQPSNRFPTVGSFVKALAGE